MLPDFAYVRAGSTQEAVEHLRDPGARVHAGGSDLLGCLHDHVFGADKVVSIAGIEDLYGVRSTNDGGISIGAMTSIVDVASDPTIVDRYPGLSQAAEAVASPQLRNQGTIGGNLCQRPRCWYFRGDFHCLKKGGEMCYAESGESRYHAIFGGSPCYIVHPSDTAPMLLALGASVRVVGPTRERLIPLAEFFVLPEEEVSKENVLGTGDLVTEVVVPEPAPASSSSYRKVRERGAWDFALASAAIVLGESAGRVDHVRVVLGGVAPIPWRSEAAEAAVQGKAITEASARAAAEAATRRAEPMEQNGYKVKLVEGIIEESLLAFA